MMSTVLRDALFQSHLADLKDLNPNVGDVFKCPICLRLFSEQDLRDRLLTDGHVWPEDIRSKSGSKIATRQRVLLCKHCNNTAGSRGDKQMQLREKVKEGWKTGKLYRELPVEILPRSLGKPIKLHARVSFRPEEPNKGQLTFIGDRKSGQWSRNDPKELKRFQALAGTEHFSILVHPHPELREDIARVGWLTAAYMLAFYTFGYRYILHRQLDPVRDCIVRSFGNVAQKNMKIPKSDDLRLQECKECYYEDPEIAMIVPLNGKVPVHLEVSFLDYHIKLPLHAAPLVLQALIDLNLDRAELLPSPAGSEPFLKVAVACTKRDRHDCRWDYVLGKPIPELS